MCIYCRLLSTNSWVCALQNIPAKSGWKIKNKFESYLWLLYILVWKRISQIFSRSNQLKYQRKYYGSLDIYSKTLQSSLCSLYKKIPAKSGWTGKRNFRFRIIQNMTHFEAFCTNSKIERSDCCWFLGGHYYLRPEKMRLQKKYTICLQFHVSILLLRVLVARRYCYHHHPPWFYSGRSRCGHN